MPDPEGRFSVAFDDDNVFTWDTTWTVLDTGSLVAGYTIDRGRSYELDRTDTGRATVEINDREGVLDPTNAGGPYYGKLEPPLQAMIRRRNPITDEWHTRFRGFIEDLDYVFDPSQQVNKLTVSLVDIMEPLANIEMLPFGFGTTAPTGDPLGQVYFPPDGMKDRVELVLTQAQIPDEFTVIFSGSVDLYETVYSPGESVMTLIAEAADGDFPGVTNVYGDRRGRLCLHGRGAKFRPEEVSAGATPGAWDFVEWFAGDADAVAGNPTDTAQIRRFAFNRGLSKIVNQALATPINIKDAAVADQTVYDYLSIALRGVRSWSAQNLLTRTCAIDDADALTETKRFAQFYVDNMAVPHNRITDIAFRSIRLDAPGAAATWDLMSRIDIADALTPTVASPGGGGFLIDSFFVEGVHETVQPLTPDMDDVTLTLDLSPRSYFDNDPWEDL